MPLAQAQDIVSEKDKYWSANTPAKRDKWEIPWYIMRPELPDIDVREIPRIERLIEAYEGAFYSPEFGMTRILALKRFICVKHRVRKEDFDAAFLFWGRKHNVRLYTDGFGTPGCYRKSSDRKWGENEEYYAPIFWRKLAGRRVRDEA